MGPMNIHASIRHLLIPFVDPAYLLGPELVKYGGSTESC